MYEYTLNIMLYTPVHAHAARDTHKKAQEPFLYSREVQSVVSHLTSSFMTLDIQSFVPRFAYSRNSQTSELLRALS